MFYQRALRQRIEGLLEQFPALLLTGARQTGKSSLLKEAFPEWKFVSLDLPSIAEEAEKRPDVFLARFPPPVVVDEIQYAPALFRNLKDAIDKNRSRNGQFLLTGSQKFQLMESVSESLAGRCALLELHSLSARELEGGQSVDSSGWLEFLFRGGYPELAANPLISAADYYRSYVSTYLERDVRNLLHVGSLRDFERFIRMAATRNAALLNVSELARDVGIASSTARQWISVVEASGVIQLVEPYFQNLGKRMVKTPKLYFLDTGLLCYLLGISSVASLLESSLLGNVWEAFVCGQICRELQRKATATSLWFWRDAYGLEVDFLLDSGSHFELIESKWTEHPGAGDCGAIRKLRPILSAQRPVRARIACRASSRSFLSEDVEIVNGFLESDWIRDR